MTILGHLNQEEGITDADENAADEFAREKLIPQVIFDRFAKSGTLQRDALIAFAKSIGIDPGIVVCRLQKEGYLDFSWHTI